MAMALFFFHFFDGQAWSEDEHGLELATAEQAYLEAIATARSMWGELLTNRVDPSRCAFEIADQRGLILFRIEFSELLESCKRPHSAPRSPVGSLARTLADTHQRAAAAKSDIAASLLEIRTSLAEANALLARLHMFQRYPAAK